MLAELKEITLKKGIQESVVFAGNRNQEWISRIVPLASVVLSPHTGRALSETALAALPVAAYDIDWQSEIIENEVTGLLVPHPDQKKLSEATERFLNDKVFAKKMGDALRVRALNMLDPKKLTRHEISEYDNLLKRFYQ
jgi:glycosyltransferase involved in cell wall biosynthesis